MNIDHSKIEYLRKIVDLASSIKINPTKSLLLQALDLPSSQSLVIQMGNRLEDFWNFVIEKNSTFLDTSKSTRQIDLAWKSNSCNYYAESKCNWDLDSDKFPATVQKIEEQAELLNAVGICFCPVTDKDMVVRNHQIRGVDWIIECLEVTAFTSEDYFKWLRSDVKQVI